MQPIYQQVFTMNLTRSNNSTAQFINKQSGTIVTPGEIHSKDLLVNWLHKGQFSRLYVGGIEVSLTCIQKDELYDAIQQLEQTLEIINQ
jgi:hypothetical protein